MIYLIFDKLDVILFPLDNLVSIPKKDCNCAFASLLII